MNIKRIVFFGTPDFSVETLCAIIEKGYEIPAVVTVPDKAAGRGLKLRESEIKIYAKSKGIQILQPEDLNDLDFQKKLKEIEPDLQIVVAFKKLPTSVFKIPPMGTINLHASLLPLYRGAAPINWAIINGETETGVTTFFINDKIDEGNILLQEKLQILPIDNAGSLYDKLKKIGANLVVKTLDGLNKNDLIAKPQLEFKEIKKAPKIKKADCKICWNRKGVEIFNFVRGLSPYPGAFTELISPEGKRYDIKVYSTSYECVFSNLPLGSIITDNKSYIKVVVADGLVSLQNVQLTGKLNMSISSFLRGFQINSEFYVSVV